MGQLGVVRKIQQAWALLTDSGPSSMRPEAERYIPGRGGEVGI